MQNNALKFRTDFVIRAVVTRSAVFFVSPLSDGSYAPPMGKRKWGKIQISLN